MSEAILGVTQSVTVAYDVATAIVFINSSLNPIIYCWRMAQIRIAVINIHGCDHRLRLFGRTLVCRGGEAVSTIPGRTTKKGLTFI